MDRFESMTTLVAAVVAGSLSAGARRLGMPLATVSRKVSELERHLKTRLLNRSGRQLTLTDAGQSYVTSCKRILEQLGEAERVAMGAYSSPRGELTITAPLVFGRTHALPVVTEFPKAWLVIGYGFSAHGYAKPARGPASFAAILAAIGVPLPEPMAWLTSLVELVGGVSLMLGAAVSFVSLPLAIVMLTAMFGVHIRYGFSSFRLKAFGPSGAVFGPVGYEINLLHIAGLVALALSAATPFSVDRWLQARRKQNSPRASQDR